MRSLLIAAPSKSNPMPTPIPGHQPYRTSMVLVEGAVFVAATAVGMDAVAGVTALSATTPARPRAIPVLRDDIGFLLGFLLPSGILPALKAA